jgi:hypothetical protein
MPLVDFQSFSGKIFRIFILAILLGGISLGSVSAKADQISTLNQGLQDYHENSGKPSQSTFAGMNQPDLSLINITNLDNDRWDDQFRLSIAGTDWEVRAIAVDYQSGIVYVGGSFSVAGSVSASHVAAWDGGAWYALGSGIDGTIEALAVDHNGNLYAGGLFGSAGGVLANAIAKWDGTSWSALGNGFTDYVVTIIEGPDGMIYAGGRFNTADGSPADYIAKWDGSTWAEVGGGASDFVYTLAFDQTGNLYAGGRFLNVGGVPANRVAKWDGNVWSALAYGLNNSVFTLITGENNELYAGGSFTASRYTPMKRVAVWSDGQWSAIGTGLGDYLEEGVNALALNPDGTLYAGGWFTIPGTEVDTGIATWDGNQWSALSGNITDIITIKLDAEGKLYAGGWFINIGGVPAQHIAMWDGSAWSTLGSEGMNGPNDYVNALALDRDGDLYLGGQFDFTGGILVNHIARWHNGTWSALGSGVDSFVETIVFDKQNNLYAGGSFSTAGGIEAPFIARWDGVQWSSIGGGTDSTIYAIAVADDGTLYAGGEFTSAGGVGANHIAKWDGSGWSPLGNGVNGAVLAIAVGNDGTVYAGGAFTAAGGQEIWGIAQWNGTQWSPLISGTDSIVTTLVIDKNSVLYAGGWFTTIGGINANSVAAWNDGAWHALGEGLGGNHNYIYELALGSNGVLYAGGDFDQAGGQYVPNAARWDGETWQGLGSGTNGPVQAFTASHAGMLYIGGQFTMAGDKTSAHIGRWINNAPSNNGEQYLNDTGGQFSVPAPGVLTNDSDPDLDPISANSVGTTDHGLLTLNEDGSFQYTPQPAFCGMDYFSYHIDDTFGYSAEATAVITVTGSIVAENDTYTTFQDTPLYISIPGVLENDFYQCGPITATLISSPIHGDLSLQLDGSFAYTPTQGFNGEDVFTYIASAGSITGTAIVTINLLPASQPPIVDAGEDRAAFEGQNIYFTGIFTDPGLLNSAVQSESFLWDFQDGSIITGTLTPVHPFADNGLYTVTLTITDTQGEVGQDSLLVTVENVDPILDELSDLTIKAGEMITLTEIFTDPGWLDTHTVIVEWAPGITETLELAADVSQFTMGQQYAQPGSYMVIVKLRDKDGGQSEQSLTVTVLPTNYMIYLPVVQVNY